MSILVADRRMRDLGPRPGRRRSERFAASRSGIAATEFAVCLPVLVLIVLATIESCTMVFLKQSLTVSAYEGIRTALEQNAATADVDATCQAVLRDRRVLGGTVAISPAGFQTLASGEYVTVTVSAPTDANAVLPGNFFRGMTFSASATMMKEL